MASSKQTTEFSSSNSSDEPGRASIDELAARLEALESKRTRHDRAGSPKRRQSMRDASRGMKIATEFVCAAFVGAFLGWMIDRLLGTLPWFMVILFCFGVVAGYMNAYRAAIGASDDDKFAGYGVFNIKPKPKDKASLAERRRETLVKDQENDGE